ncbi:MAG: response regulator transcription factor [Halanaerobiaceae bacterium]
MAEKILVVEDEKNISRFIELELVHEGYEIKICEDGKQGLEALTEEEFDLVLLDIMLPGINGIEVCRRIRDFSNIPIIMVTAKDGISDKVEGLDIGADDYITKPFAIEELLARIRALLRRREENLDEEQGDKEILKLDDLEMDTGKHQVKRQGEKIDLTKKEYDLLTYMLENKNIVISREQLLSNVWGYDYTGETNVIDVYIRYLRSKIDDPYDKKLIHTVRGVGYVLREEE